MSDADNDSRTSAILHSIKDAMQESRGMSAEMRHARITEWLRSRVQKPVDITSCTSPSASGASSEIFLVSLSEAVDFECGGQVDRFVIRVKPEYALYPEVDLNRQFACLSVAASRSTAPVPKPLTIENDATVLGAPFYLTELCSGTSAPDIPSYVSEGWIHDLSATERRELWKSGMQAIVSLQQADVSDGIIDRQVLSSDTNNPLDQALIWWRRYFEFVAEGGQYPILEEALRVLESERPRYPHSPVLVWGDASLRNMLFEGTTPSALLDFEFSHLGLREFDVAFYALFDRVMAEGFAQTRRLSGFMGVDENFDYYEVLAGHTVANREYYTLMASFYNTLAVTKSYQRVENLGVISHEQAVDNPGMQILDKLLSGIR